MSSLVIRIPQLASNCIHHRMTSSDASHMHQNNSQHLDWVRYVFGLKTSQGFVIRKVGVEEN